MSIGSAKNTVTAGTAMYTASKRTKQRPPVQQNLFQEFRDKRVTLTEVTWKQQLLHEARRWTYLGMEVEAWGGVSFQWDDDPGGAKGSRVWSPFKHDSTYFAPSEAPFMINLRVADLHGLVKALREEGCNVLDKVEESEFGKFAHVIDPDGNKVELWEPPASS